MKYLGATYLVFKVPALLNKRQQYNLIYLEEYMFTATGELVRVSTVDYYSTIYIVDGDKVD